ncbi:MAG: T9SS type A sorting domain-containing protein [bacterium]
MKKFTLLVTLLLFVVCSYAQKITRGPDIGEIYFLGPTHTGNGLYYSTDFGESAICVDSIKDILTIAGDKTLGGVYCIEMPSNLYYSDNYGYASSWIIKNGGVSDNIECGNTNGHIFSNFYSHSENYGLNFIYHTCNGYFGDVREFGVDYIDDNNGYVFSVKLTNADTSYLFRTFDKFENVEVIQEFYFPNGQTKYLFSGSKGGEVYTYFEEWGILNFSTNYAENFDIIDEYNFHDSYSFDLAGGFQAGELYILYCFVNLMWQNAHTYIYHSINYGQTFDVYHPFAKGNEPVLANFSTIDKEVHLTTPVEFSNFSIGDIIEYQWDFENDGIIDSDEESPVHIYEDAGYYSVKLSVVGLDSTNSFIKQNYIHIIDTTTSIKEEMFSGITVSPNPFDNELFLNFNKRNTIYKISVYNLQGKKVIVQNVKQNKTIKLSFLNFPSGIYLLNIKGENQSTNYKIIKN